jgi:hypothetical protein
VAGRRIDNACVITACIEIMMLWTLWRGVTMVLVAADTRLACYTRATARRGRRGARSSPDRAGLTFKNRNDL